MYLGPAHPPVTGAHALAPVRFDAPGGTIGRVPGNHLVLPDPSGAIGRLQAVLRVQDADCQLVNLGGLAPVSVNGRALVQGESAPLAAGDRVCVGGYLLVASQEDAVSESVSVPAALAPLPVTMPTAAPAALAGGVAVAAMPAEVPQAQVQRPEAVQWLEQEPQPQPGPEQQPEPVQAPEVDIFADLIGPGTLPVGSAPDISCHPFDMASAAPRNTPDPLSLLPGEPVRHLPGEDPLSFFDQVDAAHAPSIFSDRTPTSMTSGEPATPQGNQAIADMLSGDRDRHPRSTADHVTQMSGYMRPTSVRRDGSD